MRSSLLVRNIGELVTPIGLAAHAGNEMSSLKRVGMAAVLIEDGIIKYAGPEADLNLGDPRIPVFNAGGMLCVPGFVDSHTHFIFEGYRADEFFWRSKGLSYMEIHSRGGGIRRTVQSTRDATFETLVQSGRKRLASMLSMGITTVEGKSGYGLDFDTEIRQLEAIRTLDNEGPVRVVPTYLGPHTVPEEFEGNPSGYIDFVVQTVLPEVHLRGLAQFADIFCENGIFDVVLSEKYLIAAKKLGFSLKLHADEITPSGGARLAAKVRATSADHLLHTSKSDFLRMREAGVIATCLPLTAFTLREPYADARGMIDSGLAVALATDYNPGSSFSNSIPLVFAISSLYMGMTIEESLTAITLNGAASLGLSESIGSIEPGKRGNLLILSAPSVEHLAYNVGMNQVRHVIVDGRLIVSNL
jgi:imidazolonepropionase